MACICEYWFPASDAGAAMTVFFMPEASTCTACAPFHHSRLEGRADHVAVARHIEAGRGQREIAEHALSSGATCWKASGRVPTRRLPMSIRVRPSALISKLLDGGPTACEARLALSMRTCTAARMPPTSFLETTTAHPRHARRTD